LKEDVATCEDNNSRNYKRMQAVLQDKTLNTTPVKRFIFITGIKKEDAYTKGVFQVNQQESFPNYSGVRYG